MELNLDIAKMFFKALSESDDNELKDVGMVDKAQEIYTKLDKVDPSKKYIDPDDLLNTKIQ